jgi:hypothetical protein
LAATAELKKITFIVSFTSKNIKKMSKGKKDWQQQAYSIPELN